LSHGAPERTDGIRALELENRRRLYDFIRRTPGAHLREIQRGVSLPYGTAEYHLHALEEAQLVRTSEDGNLKRYFAADFAFADRALLGLLRKRPVRSVVLALLERGELSHQDLAHAGGIKPPTLSYHMPRLEAAGVVVVRREGRYSFIRLVDPKLMTRLLVAHARSFADGAVDRFLETWSGFALPGSEAIPAVKEKGKEEGGKSPPKVGHA